MHRNINRPRRLHTANKSRRKGAHPAAVSAEADLDELGQRIVRTQTQDEAYGAPYGPSPAHGGVERRACRAPRRCIQCHTWCSGEAYRSVVRFTFSALMLRLRNEPSC
jgi:hypothetical protein